MLGQNIVIPTSYTPGITPTQFNEAARNLGLPVRWHCSDVDVFISFFTSEDIKPGSLTGLKYFPKAGFETLSPYPNDFLKKLLDKVVWYANSAESYQRSLRDIDGVETRLSQAKGAYEADPSAEMREAYRCALRDRDLATRARAEVEIDFSHLPEPDQRAIQILLEEAVPAVERIYLTQMDPKNLKYLEEIVERGDGIDLYAFRHMGGVQCLSTGTDPLTSSHPDSPRPALNQGFWPPDMDGVAIKQCLADPLSRRPNVAAIGSSFVYRTDVEGTLVAHSLNAYPPIAEGLRALIAALRKAAATPGLEPTVARFLETRANEFLDTQNPYPFFAGDIDWINIRGAWDLTLGFNEEGHSPSNTTAIMEMFLGVVDATRERQGEKFRALLPWMEGEMAESLGRNYHKKNFEGLPPLRFVNAMHAGDANARYIPAAFNLPNIPPYGRRDLSKKVFLLKATEARFRDIIFPMARITMDPEQLGRVTTDDALSFVVGHENAHAAGPHRHYTVRQEGGRDITANTLLNEHSSPLEEARADMWGVASLPEAVRRGIINRDEAEKAAICFLASLNRGLALGEEDSHGSGAFVEFTTLFEMGAIVLTPEGRFRANFENDLFFNACQEIGNRLNRIQMTGNYGEINEWYRHSVEKLPDEMKNCLRTLRRMPKDIFPHYTFRFSSDF